MEPTTLALLMVVTLLVLIFSGYPVAFSLGGTAVAFFLIGLQVTDLEGFPLIDNPSKANLFPLRVLGSIVQNKILLAVPFFIFMGTMLERSKLAEDLLTTIGLLFGSMRGGLALAVVFVGTLLAAATGVVGASVVAMGMISLPVMLRYGYSPRIATGVIAASGTLGQIIPPSIVLIVLADQLNVDPDYLGKLGSSVGTSLQDGVLATAEPITRASNRVDVGALFRGTLIPGLMLAGFYGLYVAVLAWLKPETAPALPVEERSIGGAALRRRVLFVLIPPLVLIFLVLGSIFFAWATPTDAGALGASGAVLLALANRRLSRKALRETAEHTTKLCSMVMFLLVGATAFTLVFRLLDGDLWITSHLLDLPGKSIIESDAVRLLIFSNLLIFFLGFFIDFFEIAFIVLPLLAPVAMMLDINLVWLGVMIAMNLQTSFLTPPFGFALFYLRGVAPKEVSTTEIYRGVIPFILIQLVGLALVCAFPQMVTWGVG